MKLSDIIISLYNTEPTKESFAKLKRKFCATNKCDKIPSNSQIIREYMKMISRWDIKEDDKINKILTKRSVRSLSGIVPIQVLTKPFFCPGKCIFCPNDPDMPKSYIKTEPGAMRAYLNHFDPIKQVRNRLLSLTLTGHKTDKIEMIVLWWTRDVYPKEYKIEFIKWLYDACNSFQYILDNVFFADEIWFIDNSKDLLQSNNEDKKIKNTHQEEYHIINNDFDKNTTNEANTQDQINQNKNTKKISNKDLNKHILPNKFEIWQDLYQELNDIDEKIKKDLKINDHNREKFRFWIKNLQNLQFTQNIQESLDINEKAKNRIIWLTVETRPEYVNDQNCQFWRSLGVTRLEVGIQNTDDQVLEANKRWHTYKQFQIACHKLRQYGFKFSIHLMPWLYKSNTQKDINSFRQIYSDPFVKPDELKFYPTSVIPNTELYELYKSGEYKPISQDELENIIFEVLWNILPPRTRLKRLIRDIPSTEIVAWSNITNFSQLLQEKRKNNWQNQKYNIYSRLWSDIDFLFDDDFDISKGQNTNQIISEEKKYLEFFFELEEIEKKSSINMDYEQYMTLFKNKIKYIKNFTINEKQTKTFAFCKKSDIISNFEFQNIFWSIDTRHREIKNRPEKLKNWTSVFVVRKYKTSVWEEYFLSFEDFYGYLYWFCRLCLPEDQNTINFECISNGVAMIRELHVYGNVEKITKTKTENLQKEVQHKWIGKKLMKMAEYISKVWWYNGIAVISGIWVREYYHKIWYRLEWTYMFKKI